MTSVRGKLQMTGLVGAALAAGLLVYAATGGGSQNPASGYVDAMTIATAGPVALGNDATQIVLEAKNLASRMETLAPNRHIYLVLKDPHAEAQPDTLYHVYLDLPQGLKPEKGGAHDLGTLNFFNAVPLEGGPKNIRTMIRSFDVTALLKNLRQSNALGDTITVTIVPSGVPAPGAKPSIARVEIVEQ
jgi:tyrosinase